jgi:hypothetical protein
MQRVLLESSTLRSAIYYSSAATLELEFADGDVYRYFDVPEMVYNELLAADSKGNFFNKHIRNGYRFVQLS